MSDFRLPARAAAGRGSSAGGAAGKPPQLKSLFVRTCSPRCVSTLVNEDNGLCAPAAVTRHYLCPSQFNMGESACFAGGGLGAETNAV